jgi:hypothetical protein
VQMAARLELRTNYMRHQHRVSVSRSGGFSLEAPKNFPHRNDDHLFAGNCYEKPVSSFDAGDPTRAPPPRVVRERPGWNESVVVTHGLARRPQSAASTQRRQAAKHASGSHAAAARTRPSSAGGTTFGVSTFGQQSPAGWGADSSSMYESPPVDSRQHGTPAPTPYHPAQPQARAPQQADPGWSVDLTPEQAKAFVEFVTVLAEVEGSGGMSMVHLAQAAVDQATAQLRRSGSPGGGQQQAP